MDELDLRVRNHAYSSFVRVRTASTPAEDEVEAAFGRLNDVHALVLVLRQVGQCARVHSGELLAHFVVLGNELILGAKRPFRGLRAIGDPLLRIPDLAPRKSGTTSALPEARWSSSGRRNI